MANNRMSFVCTKCNERFGVAKYYPRLTDGWYTSLNGETSSDRMDSVLDWFISLQDFLKSHSHVEFQNEVHVGDSFIRLEYETNSELQEA